MFNRDPFPRCLQIVFALLHYLFLIGGGFVVSLWSAQETQALSSFWRDQGIASCSRQTVWDPSVIGPGKQFAWIRDPSIYQFMDNVFVMTGTNRYLVEFWGASPRDFTTCVGTAYETELFSPDGRRNLRSFGFLEWDKFFITTPHGIRMLSSLKPSLSGSYNRGFVNRNLPRQLVAFRPVKNGRKTPSGFFLDWIMISDRPVLANSYSGRVYSTGLDGTFLIHPKRFDNFLRSTCQVVRRIDLETLTVGPFVKILCSGNMTEYDWDTDRPFPSEVRFSDGGGLIEGGWFYYSQKLKTYFLLYSSGDYASKNNYAGFVATCESPLTPCRKIYDDRLGRVRVFLKGSSRNYVKVGRPYPVVENGKLVDIFFHARRRGDKKDSILRCQNFLPDMLEKFLDGGPGCLFD